MRISEHDLRTARHCLEFLHRLAQVFQGFGGETALQLRDAEIGPRLRVILERGAELPDGAIE